jgi:hypothetical protein
MNEKIRPDEVLFETKTNPYRTKNKRGKWTSKNPEFPPGILNNSHSFQ